MDDLASAFRTHGPRVRAIAFRILHDRADAEDVLQETFAAAWRLSPTYDEQRGSTASWLRCMARSRAIDRLRMRQANERVLHLLPAVPSIAEPEKAPGRQECEHLRRAVAQLPERQRTAIELAYFSGLTHQEIAARTRSPLGTVKTRLRLGLQRLAEALSDS